MGAKRWLVLATVLAIVLVPVAALTGGQVTALAAGRPFSAPREFPAGAPGGAFSMVAGDFNRDGRLDVAFGSGQQTMLMIGNADGSFQAAREVAREDGSIPYLAVADLNHDGKLDLAIANIDVYVFLGNGDATFRLAARYLDRGSPLGIAVADFNSDSIPDVVVLHSYGATVSLFRGVGDGTLAPPADFPIAGYGAALVVGDFNRDGKPDAAATHCAGACGNGYAISVLRGTGAGSFQSALTLPIAGRADGLTAADFNRDGSLDAVVTAQLGIEARLSVFLGNGDGTFKPSIDLTRPDSSQGGVAAGDVNGDGTADLVTGWGYGGVGVLLGIGNGHFQGATGYPVGSLAGGILIADFNRDGKPDMAVGTHGVAILFNEGDGRFAAAPTYGLTSGQPTSVATGDFNLDGKRDLAEASGGGVAILLGRGDGSFGYPVSYSTGAGGDGSLAVGDFNGDAKPDLAVTHNTGNRPGQVAILLGNGDGTFQAAIGFSIGIDYPQPTAIAAGDWNGDGKLDLAVTQNLYRVNPGIDTFPDYVVILLGRGDGSLQAPTYYAVGVNPTGIAVADFNGDGKRDLAVANGGRPGYGYSTLSVLLGNGDGTFQPAASYSAAASSVVVGDFNGDGKLDLVTANYGGITVVKGNGDGTFHFAPTTRFQGASRVVPLASSHVPPRSLATGDFNGDNRLDLALGDALQRGVVVALGNGDATFQAGVVYATGLGFASSIAVDDLNSDSRPDLVVSNQDSSDVSILLDRVDGTFQTATNFGGLPAAGPFAIGDFDRDGRLDMVAVYHSVQFLRGTPTGFQVQLPFGSDPGVRTLATADFNGDGKLDLVGSRFDGGVAVLLGRGDGTFDAPAVYPTDVFPSPLVVGDFNQDSRLDLAVGNWTIPSSISILLGNGDGTFKPAMNSPAPQGALAAADFDQDGKLDLAVASAGTPPTPANVVIWRGKGDGTFQPGPTIVLGSSFFISAAAASDLNGDGKPDLVVTLGAYGTPSSVAVLLGNGDGSFQPATTYTVGDNPGSIGIADLDGDHNPDIAVANIASDNLSILLGSGRGGFASASTYDVGLVPWGLATADFDGDGVPELAIGTSGGIAVLHRGNVVREGAASSSPVPAPTRDPAAQSSPPASRPPRIP